jgi:DNA-binding response OmpR family regulator
MVLLIVEDDPHYARVMVDLARDNGFKVPVAHRGDALTLAATTGRALRCLPAGHAGLTPNN